VDTSDAARFRAVLGRVIVGLLAIGVLPVLHPGMAAFRWLFVAYIAVVGVQLILIRKHIGGSLRAHVSGAIDLALLTFLVHRAGSVGTTLVSLYFIAGMLNALVVGFREGIGQAIVGSIAYSTVVFLESAHVIAYAPDAPKDWIVRAPTFGEAATSAGLLSSMLIASTALVGMLVRTIEAREKTLEELSLRDPLTQLWNRRHLIDRIEEGLAHTRRGRPLALVMIDLDRFKKVNDGQGHLRGDAFLQEVASALQRSTRATDLTSRYGGDEFVVLLFDTDETSARSVADRVVAAIRESAMRFGADVTASAGLAIARRDDSPASLLRRADENAYAAKRSGGDRFVLAA
jgi:diguanylate cyclase (GGDEF)-like protein